MEINQLLIHMTKFLELMIDNILSWKNHTDQLMSKLSKSCYAIRTVKYFMPQPTLRMIYLPYVHSIMTYSIILWGNSSYSSNIFKIQKRIIRVVMNSCSRDFCWVLFKKLNILPLQSQYIFSLLLLWLRTRIYINPILRFMVLTPDMVLIYIVLRRVCSKKELSIFGIKVFNKLPSSIKNLSHEEQQFRLPLKRFLLMNSFYTLDECFNWKLPKDLDSL